MHGAGCVPTVCFVAANKPASRQLDIPARFLAAGERRLLAAVGPRDAAACVSPGNPFRSRIAMPRKPQASVEPRANSRWAVQTDGTRRADSLHDTKSAPIKRGRELAENQANRNS